MNASAELIATNYESADGSFNSGAKLDEDDVFRKIGAEKDGSFYFRIKGLEDTSSFTDNFSNSNYGVLLASDGGAKFQSLANPALNANNANSPYQAPIPATVCLLGLGFLGFSARKKTSLNLDDSFT